MMPHVKKTPLAEWNAQHWVIKLYEFISLADVPSFLSTDDTQLYNRPAYLFVQSETPIYTLLMEDQDNSQQKWMHFRKVGKRLINAQKSPWGGWEGIAKFPKKVLETHFLSILEAVVKFLKCESICWTLPPDLYFPTPLPCCDERLQQASIDTIYLPITTEPFLSHCQPQEARRYRKCLRAQMVVKPLVITKGIFEFILQCYNERHYQPSISYQMLTDLVAKFPNHYAAAGVFHHNQLIAATIYVKVTKTITYNFMPASLLSFRHMSPIVFLYDYLYSLCQSSGTKYLDLGVSQNSDGTYKKSLAQFKLNLGGRSTKKQHVLFNIYQALTSS